jgi:hypothetical protein
MCEMWVSTVFGDKHSALPIEGASAHLRDHGEPLELAVGQLVIGPRLRSSGRETMVGAITLPTASMRRGASVRSSRSATRSLRETHAFRRLIE